MACHNKVGHEAVKLSGHQTKGLECCIIHVTFLPFLHPVRSETGWGGVQKGSYQYGPFGQWFHKALREVPGTVALALCFSSSSDESTSESLHWSTKPCYPVLHMEDRVHASLYCLQMTLDLPSSASAPPQRQVRLGLQRVGSNESLKRMDWHQGDKPGI